MDDEVYDLLFHEYSRFEHDEDAATQASEYISNIDEIGIDGWAVGSYVSSIEDSFALHQIGSVCAMIDFADSDDSYRSQRATASVVTTSYIVRNGCNLDQLEAIRTSEVSSSVSKATLEGIVTSVEFASRTLRNGSGSDNYWLLKADRDDVLDRIDTESRTGLDSIGGGAAGVTVRGYGTDEDSGFPPQMSDDIDAPQLSVPRESLGGSDEDRRELEEELASAEVDADEIVAELEAEVGEGSTDGVDDSSDAHYNYVGRVADEDDDYSDALRSYVRRVTEIVSTDFDEPETLDSLNITENAEDQGPRAEGQWTGLWTGQMPTQKGHQWIGPSDETDTIDGKIEELCAGDDLETEFVEMMGYAVIHGDEFVVVFNEDGTLHNVHGTPSTVEYGAASRLAGRVLDEHGLY